VKPDENLVLADFAARFAGEIAPQVQPAYLASAIGLTAGILGMIAEDWDRSAARRVEENRAIRRLFQRATGLGLEPELATRLAALGQTNDDDLRLSALEAGNEAVRAALIDLHAAVEAMDGGAARALNDAIWAELSASTARRKLSTGSF
jgi:hypothetical protein